ncbi:MAG: hypothetical protein ACYDDA_12425 [Acidiferrobacteraceae bacterium]
MAGPDGMPSEVIHATPVADVITAPEAPPERWVLTDTGAILRLRNWMSQAAGVLSAARMPLLLRALRHLPLRIAIESIHSDLTAIPDEPMAEAANHMIASDDWHVREAARVFSARILWATSRERIQAFDSLVTAPRLNLLAALLYEADYHDDT